MEPVSSCSVAASFPRLAVFRTPATPKTRIAATTTLSRVLHLGLIQGPRKKLCIRAHTKRERVSRRRLLVVRAYSAPLNIFLRFVRQVVAAALHPAFLCTGCIVLTVESPRCIWAPAFEKVTARRFLVLREPIVRRQLSCAGWMPYGEAERGEARRETAAVCAGAVMRHRDPRRLVRGEARRLRVARECRSADLESRGDTRRNDFEC